MHLHCGYIVYAVCTSPFSLQHANVYKCYVASVRSTSMILMSRWAGSATLTSLSAPLSLSPHLPTHPPHLLDTHAHPAHPHVRAVIIVKKEAEEEARLEADRKVNKNIKICTICTIFYSMLSLCSGWTAAAVMQNTVQPSHHHP